MTGWKRPIAAGSSSICTIGLYGGDARCGWRTRRRRRPAGRTRSSASSPPACRCGPSTPAPSGWVSGTRPLALNVVSTGAPEPLGQRAHLGRGAARAPCPTMITGRRAARSRSAAAVSAASSGRTGRSPTAGPSGRAAGASTRLDLHLVGQHQVGHAAAVDGVLDRQRGQLGVVDCRRARSWSRRRRRGTPPTGRGPGTRRGRAPSTAPARRSRPPGRRSSLASYRPVSRLVEPGPAMAKHAAGRPVSLP